MAVIDTRRASIKQVTGEPNDGRGGLPGYMNDQRISIGHVPSISTSAFAAPGRALAAVGGAIGDLAGAFSDHNDKSNQYNDALKHAEFQNKTALDYADHQRNYNGSPDGAGFTKSWLSKFDAHRQVFMGDLSEKGRDKYGAPVEGFRGNLNRRAATHEFDSRAKFQEKSLDSAMLINEKTLINNPTQENINSAKINLTDIVQNMNIPDHEKATRIQMITRRLDVMGAMGLAKSGKTEEARTLFNKIKTDILKTTAPQATADMNELKLASREDKSVPDIEHLKPEFKNKVIKLQQSLGKHLIVNSGYRDPAHNKKVGGVTGSRHMHKDAVDLQWPKGATIADKQNIIALARKQGFMGIGVGDGILHLDTGRKRAWGYTDGKASNNIPAWAKAALNGKAATTEKTGGIQSQIASAAKDAGIDPDYLVNLAASESSFKHGVKADTSSAQGLFQLTKQTTKNVGSTYGKKSVSGEIADGIAITKANQQTMTKYLGRAPENHELHLAHVFGAGRASGILSATDDTPVSKVLPSDVLNANKGLFKNVQTVGQLKAWAVSKQKGKSSGSLVKSQITYDKTTAKVIDTVEKYITGKEITMSMNGKSSLNQSGIIDQLRAEAVAHPENATAVLRYQMAQKFKTNFDTQMKKDPHAVAAQQGLVPLTPLFVEGKSIEETMSARMESALKISEVYGIKPVLLRPEEAAQFKARWDEMEVTEQLTLLGGIDKVAGKRSATFIGEFAKSNVILAHAGGLYVNGRSDTAERVLTGAKLMSEPASRDVIESLKAVDVRESFSNVFGKTFPNLRPEEFAGFVSTAKALAMESIATGKQTSAAAALEAGMNEAAGQHVEPNGDIYGGILDYGGQKVLVPPEMQQDDIEDVFDAVTGGHNLNIYNTKGSTNPEPEEQEIYTDLFLRISGSMPVHPLYREPVTNEQLEGATFVTMAPGQYKIVLSDGFVLRPTTPDKTRADGTQEFVPYLFDVKKAKEVIDAANTMNQDK